MPNKNTKEYIIKKFNEAGIPLEVKKQMLIQIRIFLE